MNILDKSLGIKQPGCVSDFEEMIDSALEHNDDENAFDTYTKLENSITALKKYRNECIELLIFKSFQMQESLINDNICPECGGSLENIADESRETFVPCGETFVPLGTGYRTVCSSCGYEVED